MLRNVLLLSSLTFSCAHHQLRAWQAATEMAGAYGHPWQYAELDVRMLPDQYSDMSDSNGRRLFWRYTASVLVLYQQARRLCIYMVG